MFIFKILRARQSLTPVSMAIYLTMSHFIGYVVIKARPAANGNIGIDVNNSDLDGHAIQINHTPDGLWRPICCYTLVNTVYEIVKSSGRFANQPNPVPDLRMQ